MQHSRIPFKKTLAIVDVTTFFTRRPDLYLNSNLKLRPKVNRRVHVQFHPARCNNVYIASYLSSKLNITILSLFFSQTKDINTLKDYAVKTMFGVTIYALNNT